MGVLTVLLGSPLPEAAAVTRTTAVSPPPLQVTIDTLQPATVPAQGRVTITGEIKNTSDATWTDLQVYMLRSTAPITSEADLASAAASDPASQIGSRVASSGLYDQVGDLAPGQSTPYVLSVPRRRLGLSGEPGVYWFGVHVLGAENGVRDSVADGRARAFLPLVPPGTPATRLALVMPFRAPVQRDPEGQLLDLRHWQQAVAPDGRLDRLLRLGSRASGTPLTWVVDPAVLDAVRSVAGQNPPLDIGPTDEETSGGETGGSQDASPSPSPSPSASGPGASAGAGTTSPLNAAAWLRMFQNQAAGHDVMVVPYGGLDLASAQRHHMRQLFGEARDLSARTMKEVGVRAAPVVAPESGYLPRQVLRTLAPTDQVLMSDLAFPSSTGPVVRTARGTQVVLTETAAAMGGPAPNPRYSALAVRQRILSEAALHALSPDRKRPLVVSTPPHWDPGPGWSDASFFEGLSQPWLTMVGLPSVLGSAHSGKPADGLVYPPSERRRELPFANLLVSNELARTGGTLATLLSRNDTVDEQLAKLGLLAAGTEARARPHRAARRARATNAHIRELMDQVQVEGPPFVTMSSEKGPIQITVVNGLDQEVTVGVHARTGTSDLQITTPDPVTLGPGRRASLRLTAKARDIGVHRVLLEATDAAGEPLGSTAQFNVRTSQVGLVIWVIMGAGGAVLLVAIGARLFRRVRQRRSSRTLLSRGS